MVVAAGIVVLALLGPLQGLAGAHASVVEVRPGPAEVLDESPRKVEILFTEGVDVKLGGVFVYDGDGERVDVGTLRQPAPERLVLPIDEELGDGSYIVTWRAVSEDTHPIQGTWTFQVGDASASNVDVAAVAAGLLAGQEADRAVSIGWGIARWIVFAAMALLVGGVVFGTLIWPRARDARATRRIVTVGWAGLTVATVVGILLFGAYSRGGSLGDALDPDVVRDALDTRLGHVWLLRIGVLAVAFVLLRVLFARRPADSVRLPTWWLPLAAVVGVVLVSTPGLAGHASAGDHRTLAVVADAVHVAAMAVWLGGLVVLVTAVLPRDDVGELEVASRRFSRVALWCVGALVLTGAFQTWRVVDGLDSFRDDEYGRVLVIKLVVFAALLVVASFSREITARLTSPRSSTAATSPPLPTVRGAAVDLAEGPPPGGAGDALDGGVDRARELRRLRRSVWLEGALGAAVLVVTAVLVNVAPPAESSFRDGATGVTIEAPLVTLDLTASPGAAGLNDLHVNTYSPQGTPLAVSAVELRLSLPDRDIAPLVVPLRQLGPGHYLSPGLDIPLAGTWRVEAVVRTGPVDRADLTGDLEIR